MNYPLFMKKVANLNKSSFVAFLLLLFFVIYAISPLSLSYSVNRTSATHTAAASETSLNILLLEVAWAKIFTTKNINDADSKGRILIRKTRAVLSENVNSRVTSLGSLALLSCLVLFSEKASSRLIAFINGQHSVCEVNPLHSGPAPPFLK